MTFYSFQIILFFHSAVSDDASGWVGWALAHPEFRSSVNPITTRRAEYAHLITASPLSFENPAASLLLAIKTISIFLF